MVPNKFPALQIEGTLDRRGEGLYDKMNGVGAHEVVIESPEHDVDFADLRVEQIAQVLWAYRERMIDLHQDRRFRYVLIFKNHGEAAGATLEHTHTQLIATPIIPKHVQEELDGSRRYFELKERCVFCDIVEQETADGNGKRVVLASNRVRRDRAVRAALPVRDLDPAARPRGGVREPGRRRLPGTRERAQGDAAAPQPRARTAAVQLRDPHRAGREADHEYYHWHLEIMPKLTRVAGFEWGSGFYINPTPPEDAAAYLREVRGPAPEADGAAGSKASSEVPA